MTAASPPHADVAALLERVGAARADEVVAVEPLAGGVSSDVFRVDLRGRALCVKFAAERLRVAAEWRAPLRRARAEYEWLSFAGGRFPGSTPAVLGYDAQAHGFAMAYLPEETHPNWKRELLAGRVEPAMAAAAGARLAAIHAASAEDAGVPARFANADDFEALRLEPYLRFTAGRHPRLADRLHALADALAGARVALVHGDVSPKNILCGSDGPVFIDAECATFGDPAFDPAFCLNHLVIKALVLPGHRADLRLCAEELWSSYRAGVTWETADGLERRCAALLPALMLARVDGKSPLEYLDQVGADRVRRHALDLLDRQPDSVAGVIHHDLENVR